jgi:tRNA G10  N-methylase Trm11
MYFSVLGANRALSAFELKRCQNIEIVNFYNKFVTFSIKNEIDPSQLIEQLGGSVKIGRVLFSANSEEQIISKIEQDEYLLGDTFAVSDYSGKISDLKKLKTKVKGILKSSGYKPRFLDNKTKDISTASILHNRVLEKGFELCIFYDHLAQEFIVGSTVAIQNLEFYSQSDFDRPQKHLEFGILNPKIAKMMINLCQPSSGDTLYDPFCGSGTILMEGLVLGLNALGSDSSSKALEKCEQNLEWFCDKFGYPKNFRIFEHDARYPHEDLGGEDFNVNLIVTEPFLGPQISNPVSIEQFSSTKSNLVKMYKKSFRNFKQYLKKGSSVCFVLPVTTTTKGLRSTFFEETLETLGFTIIRPKNYLPDIYREVTSNGILTGHRDSLVKKEVILAQVG